MYNSNEAAAVFYQMKKRSNGSLENCTSNRGLEQERGKSGNLRASRSLFNLVCLERIKLTSQMRSFTIPVAAICAIIAAV